jgi:hypothetical protein
MLRAAAFGGILAAALLWPALRVVAGEPAAARFENPLYKTELSIPDAVSGGAPVLRVKRHVGERAGRRAVIPPSTHAWEKVGRVAVPSQVLIGEPAQAVALLGTAGDTRDGLGLIEVRSYEGRVIAFLDLSENIPDLEKKSADWAKATGKSAATFPWIVEARLLPDGVRAQLVVCGGAQVELSLRDGKLSVAKAVAQP